MKLEIRSSKVDGLEVRFSDALEIREETRADGVKTKKVGGYAAVFNSYSEDLGGFREIIKPGAFDRAMKGTQDVKALIGHNRNQLLGRTKNGTLSLRQDNKGLLVEVIPSDTTHGRDLIAQVERGDIDGMSFGFNILGDAWKTIDGKNVRELTDIDLREVTFTAFPAYKATTAQMRSMPGFSDEELSEVNAALLRREHKLTALPGDEDILLRAQKNLLKQIEGGENSPLDSKEYRERHQQILDLELEILNSVGI